MQSGDRSGDRPLLAVALCHADARGWLGRGRGERRAVLSIGSDPECALACDFSCDVSGDENSMFVGAYRICVPSGEKDTPARVKGLELLHYI